MYLFVAVVQQAVLAGQTCFGFWCSQVVSVQVFSVLQHPIGCILLDRESCWVLLGWAGFCCVLELQVFTHCNSVVVVPAHCDVVRCYWVRKGCCAGCSAPVVVWLCVGNGCIMTWLVP